MGSLNTTSSTLILTRKHSSPFTRRNLPLLTLTTHLPSTMFRNTILVLIATTLVGYAMHNDQDQTSDQKLDEGSSAGVSARVRDLEYAVVAARKELTQKRVSLPP